MSRRAALAAFLFAAFAALAVVIQARHWFGDDALDGSGATVGGPFALTDSSGKRVTEKDFLGRYLLIYFGFTSCPDVCPTELSVMAAALDRLGADGKNVQPILITVDPERDTVETLADYVASFHPRLIGLTGTVEEIQAVAKAYRVYFAKTAPDATGDYSVDHSSVVYLMDPDGHYLTVFGRDVDAEAMAEGIRHHLK
ncbi:MAG: SCO family protein [Alphaproteobacteria bacterium]